MTTAADLQDRITLQRPVPNVNALGEEVITWAVAATTWAQVRALTTRQWFSALQVQTEITHQVVIRYRAGVQPGWRIVWRGLLLEIVGEPIPVGAREWLRITAASRARDEQDDLPGPPPLAAWNDAGQWTDASIWTD
jgi:SPP1 family predicted phage head-tail adaptor